jgi:hypothetical protein
MMMRSNSQTFSGRTAALLFTHDYKYGHATVVRTSRKTHDHGNGNKERRRSFHYAHRRAYVSTKVINKNMYVISNVTQVR